MNIFHNNISNFFEELLSDLNCQYDTKTYIIGIYKKYQTAELDLSKDNITLQFAQARNTQNFAIYQNLGDWIFFINTIFPQNICVTNKNYYDTIARLSYYSCYKLINRQWKLFEELADNFTELKTQVKKRIPQLKM